MQQSKSVIMICCFMSENKKNNSDSHRDVERLVHQHSEALYAYALLRIGRPDTAEDMVQETLLAALKNWESFSGGSTERTWLIGILRHKIIDFFRRDKFSEDVDEQSCQSEYFDRKRHWKDKLSNWKSDPEKLAENQEFIKILNGCLKALSQIMAKAFIMRELEGINSEEICKLLEISETNLWVRLHRARLQLRRCLELNWFSR